MTKKKKKILIFGSIGIVVILLLVVSMTKSGEKTQAVETDKAKRSDITATVSAEGKMEAKTQVKMSASVPAKIIHLRVQEGEHVKKGQVLVELDQVTYRAAVDQYKATLETNKARLEQSQPVYERMKTLYEQKLASQQEYDAARSDYNANRALVDQAQAALVQAKDNLDKTTLISPVDGTVTDLNAEEGEIVLVGTMNNPGTVILTVSDLSKIQGVVNLDETDVANVKLGQEARIRIDAIPDTSFKGKVIEIAGTGKVEGLGSQNQVTNFEVKVLLEEEVPQVRPGMSCSVDITTNHHSNAINLPIQAVVIRELSEDSLKALKNFVASGMKPAEKTKSSEALASTEKEGKSKDTSAKAMPPAKKKEVPGVFLMRDTRALFVPVETGIADKQNIEIAQGITDGEEVITGSYRILRTLKSGDKVKATPSGMGKPEEKK